MPSTETKYGNAVIYLRRYTQSLQYPTENPQHSKFYTRAGDLWTYLEIIIARLGEIYRQLEISRKPPASASGIRHYPDDQMESITIEQIFYQARGMNWALVHILHAIKIDFSDILDKPAMNKLDKMIHAMENSISLLNMNEEDGFGISNKHTLSMAKYIRIANNTGVELYGLMNTGVNIKTERPRYLNDMSHEQLKVLR